MNSIFPEWLNHFTIKIEDECETMLLEEQEVNPQNVRFGDPCGISIDSPIYIKDERYIVSGFQLYSDMINAESKKNQLEGFYFDLHIVVSKIE